MFGLGPATKIYIAVEGVDMRKGFDGLYGLVRDCLGHDPLSGHLFLFANRERTRHEVRRPKRPHGSSRSRHLFPVSSLDRPPAKAPPDRQW